MFWNVLLIRDHIFSLKHQPKTQLIEILGALPSQLAIEDINDFWSLAEYYDKKTPSSFKKVCNLDFPKTVFNNRRCFQDIAGYVFDPKLPDKGISQMLCLPISVTELISHTNRTVTNSLKFFVMDCRPAEQYNAGHLPIAFPLDSTLVCILLLFYVILKKRSGISIGESLQRTDIFEMANTLAAGGELYSSCCLIRATLLFVFT